MKDLDVRYFRAMIAAQVALVDCIEGARNEIVRTKDIDNLTALLMLFERRLSVEGMEEKFFSSATPAEEVE